MDSFSTTSTVSSEHEALQTSRPKFRHNSLDKYELKQWAEWHQVAEKQRERVVARKGEKTLKKKDAVKELEKKKKQVCAVSHGFLPSSVFVPCSVCQF